MEATKRRRSVKVRVSEEPLIELDLTYLYNRHINIYERCTRHNGTYQAAVGLSLGEAFVEGMTHWLQKYWGRPEFLDVLAFQMDLNEKLLYLGLSNERVFKQFSLYERTIVMAHPHINYGSIAPEVYYVVLDDADKEKLRSAGDPIPAGEHFTLYRGVCKPHKWAVRGFSWTSDPGIASWFAQWHAEHRRGVDPVVFSLCVPRDRILFYTNNREEKEFVLLPHKKDKPRKLPQLPPIRHPVQDPC